MRISVPPSGSVLWLVILLASSPVFAPHVIAELPGGGEINVPPERLIGNQLGANDLLFERLPANQPPYLAFPTSYSFGVPIGTPIEWPARVQGGLNPPFTWRVESTGPTVQVVATGERTAVVRGVVTAAGRVTLTVTGANGSDSISTDVVVFPHYLQCGESKRFTLTYPGGSGEPEKHIHLYGKPNEQFKLTVNPVAASNVSFIVSGEPRVDIVRPTAVSSATSRFRSSPNTYDGTGPYYSMTLVTPLATSGPADYTLTLECGPQPLAPVVLSVAPEAMLHVEGSSPPASSLTLTNISGASLDLSLGITGNFFNVEPTSFTLQAGQSRRITISGTSQRPGEYAGSIVVSGPSGRILETFVRMTAVVAPSTGTVTAEASANRVDVAAPLGASAFGSFNVTNRGTAILRGVLAADVPWITPNSGAFVLNPGETRQAGFSIDRSKRPDGDDPTGSVSGTVSVLFAGPATGAKHPAVAMDTPGVNRTSVQLNDTVASAASRATIPAILPNEIAYFLPGAGHVQGGVGLFLTDLNLANVGGTSIPAGLKMYFLGVGSNQTDSYSQNLGQLKVDVPTNYKDVVKTMFQREQLGSLQIRTSATNRVVPAATVFNVSNRAGFYGTAIPAFRSDRSIGVNERMFLTGLRKDATGYTNLYIQETSGADAIARITYLSKEGATLKSVDQPVSAFAVLPRGSDAPDNAVAAVISVAAGSQGKIAAYATPVDARSGDTWSVADWSKQTGYASTETVVIPIAGAAPGANNTFFRTDVSITNSGTLAASGTLTYFPRGANPISRTVTLSPSQTLVELDVVTRLFGVSGASLGWIRFQPSGGSFAVSSRTYNTAPDGVATYGTGVPALATSTSLVRGQLRKFGGVTDSSLDSISRLRPGTFRTNAFLVETSGQPATVKVSLRYAALGSVASQNVRASKDVAMAPYQLAQIGRITADLLGDSRENFREMENVQIEFEVIDGAGAVLPVLSMTENGTGDSILRVD